MAENVSTAVARLDPQALLQKAVENNAGIETLERLVTLAKDVRAFQAREAWHNAMAEFHRHLPPIKKTKTAKIMGRATYSYSYAPLDGIMEIISPIMGDLGLHVSWTSPKIEPTRVVVKCTISHALGHAEDSGEVAMPISAESMGANAAQRVGIALTYARRYSLLSIAGLAPEDDDDSESLGDPPGPAAEDLMPKTTGNATPPSATNEAQVPAETDEEALIAEARAREQAEAGAETTTQAPIKLDRPVLFSKVRDRARKEGLKEAELLKRLTGRTSMAGLNDQECRDLDKALSVVK